MDVLEGTSALKLWRIPGRFRKPHTIVSAYYGLYFYSTRHGFIGTFRSSGVKMNIKDAFGSALKRARLAKNLTQEDFSLISSRVFVSALELGKRGVTLEKVFGLAKPLKVNPVTLVALTYLATKRSMTPKDLLAVVRTELEELT